MPTADLPRRPQPGPSAAPLRADPNRPTPGHGPRHAPQRRWTSWSTAVPRAAAAGLAVAFAVTTLVASATVPAAKSAAKSKSARPDYLQPIGALVHNHFLAGPLLTGDAGTVGVPAGTPPVPAQADPKVVAQQAPAIAQFQGAAGTLTPAALATLALQRGCSPSAAVIASAISMAESGGSPGAQGDIGLMTPVWDWSAGLWQIRGLRAERGTGGLRDSIANQDVTKNAAAMFAISQGCTDWTPWSTYNNGAYRSYLALAQRAVEYVIRYANAHGGHYPPVPAPNPSATIPVQSGGGGADPAAAQAAPPPGRTSSAAPKPHSSATGTAPGGGAAKGSTPAPAKTSAAAGSTSPKQVLPLPTKTTVVPLPTLKLPLPSTTLPLPLPTVTLPALLP